MPIVIKLKLEGLDRLRKAVIGNPALMQRIVNAWSTVYRSFTRSRFHKLSRGGGDWPALSSATLAGRRKGGGGAAILRDTGAMFAALNPQLGSGGMMRTTPIQPLGFKADLSSATTYKDGATLSDVASYHHYGEGRLPKREILVEPDREAIESMANHGKRILTKGFGER